MASIVDDLKRAYNNGTVAIQFIFINLAVFLVLNLIGITGFLFKADYLGAVLPWISGSSALETMLYRPWTIITYMFVHEGFGHVFWNMITLYIFGRLFVQYLNEKRFITVYFLGGIAGFLAYFASYNFFPVFENSNSIIFGASASVMAIMMAITTFTPNYEFRLPLIGGIKLKYVTIFLIVFDLRTFYDGNWGGHIAHWGGLLFGFLFSLNLKKGKDWSKGFFGFTDFFKNLFKPKSKMKVASSTKGYKAQYYDNRSKAKKQNQQDIDRILDKISQSGYDSLSKDEKETLFKASNK